MATTVGASFTGDFSRRGFRNVVEKEITAVVQQTREQLLANIRGHMGEAKSGRKYYRPGGKVHTASAPGEFPAIDSGKLSQNVKATPKFRGMVEEITFKMKYATYLEDGTAKMDPRPFGQRSLDEIRPYFVSQLRARLAKLNV